MQLNIKYALAIFILCGFNTNLTSNEVTPQYSATITRDIFGVPHVHELQMQMQLLGWPMLKPMMI